jgi:hypothetical protein
MREGMQRLCGGGDRAVRKTRTKLRRGIPQLGGRLLKRRGAERILEGRRLQDAVLEEGRLGSLLHCADHGFHRGGKILALAARVIDTALLKESELHGDQAAWQATAGVASLSLSLSLSQRSLCPPSGICACTGRTCSSLRTLRVNAALTSPSSRRPP